MKKILIMLLAVVMLFSVTVTAYADDAAFTPTTYKTAQGTAVVDGVKDDAYELSDMLVVEKGGLDRELLEGHATAKVWTLWDHDCLYVYAEVNDTTPGGVPTAADPEWENESVEIYIDYEDNKNFQNSLAISAEACQLRICRYPESFSKITGQGLFQPEFAEGTTYKVIDNKENGYIVEAAIKHSTNLTGKMGFSLQINDDMDGDKVRDSIVYVDALQMEAWKYTDLLDTIEFENYAPKVEEPASSEPVSSEAPADEPSQTASEENSSKAPVVNEPTLDPVVTLIVFVLAAAAIVAVIIFTTKKK